MPPPKVNVIVPTCRVDTEAGSNGPANGGPDASNSPPEYVTGPPARLEATYHLGWLSGPYTKSAAKSVSPWWKMLSPQPDSEGSNHISLPSRGCGVASAEIEARERTIAATKERGRMETSVFQTLRGLKGSL